MDFQSLREIVRHYLSDRDMRPLEDIGLVVLSGMVYLSLRILFHHLIRSAGYFDGGLLSYDSYYPFAFAQELARTGAVFLFHNPFGTLDQVPRLFNLYATLLLPFQPLAKLHLFAFDCFLGTLFTATTSYFVCRLLSSLKIHEKAMVLSGGGVAFIAVFLGKVPETDALSAGSWGLTYLLNEISTPEIIYHFLFFFGLCSLLARRNSSVILVMGFLSFLHPFTAITFNVSAFCLWLHNAVKTRCMLNSEVRYAVYALLSTALIILVFVILLPSQSKDAAYMKMVYERAHFHIGLETYILFLLFPALWCLKALFVLRPAKQPENSEKIWIFLGTAIFCLLMSTSYLYTDRIVQPAHWSRVYPYIFLFGAAGLIDRRKFQSPIRKWMLAGDALVLCLALTDSALGVGYIGKALLTDKRPPLFLTFDQAQIIKKARDLPSGRFLYLRDSSNASFFGDFEYALMSLTHQKAFAGHAFFSPFRETVLHHSYTQMSGYSLPKRLLEMSDYIVFDKNMHHKMASLSGETLYEGTNLALIRKASKK
jgi:hypothetical protein